MCSLGKTLLAFALLHFVLQGQICLLLQVFLDFLLLHSSSAGAVRDLANWPWRGDSSRPRSGAVTDRTRLPRRRRVREELPHIRGQGQRPRGATQARGRGSGLDELPHIRGHGWQLRGATAHPRSGSYMGAGRPKGATPSSKSGGAAVRRYPSSKVRSSTCTLLEQP